jgi:hypothetical protein
MPFEYLFRHIAMDTNMKESFRSAIKHASKASAALCACMDGMGLVFGAKEGPLAYARTHPA